jgi:hypothetical protein
MKQGGDGCSCSGRCLCGDSGCAQPGAAEDHAQAAQEELASSGGRWQRFQAWCGTMREHLAGWGQQAQDYYRGWFGRRDEPEPQPAQESTQGMEPQL